MKTIPLQHAKPVWPLAALAAWVLAALVIGASGALARVPLPPPPIAFTLAAVLILATRRSAAVRQHLDAWGARPLVALHLIRIVVGGYFLVLYRRGEIPGEFAIAAGIGDILVGVGALLVLAFVLPANTPARRRAFLFWNTVGLVDILAVLANAMRIMGGEPTLGLPFQSLPLALAPTLVVPLVIASHFLLFRRAT